MKTIHAWFSERAAVAHGSWGMTLPSSKKVRITCVGDDFSDNANYYMWPDKVYVGEVINDSYHDFWRGDNDTIEYYYEYELRHGTYHAVAKTRVSGSWTDKYHSIESNKIDFRIINSASERTARLIESENIDSRLFDLTIKRSSIKTTSSKPVLKIGDVCDICGKEYKVRELATSSYVGCWCIEK